MSTPRIKKVFRINFVWQEEAESRWLAEQSADGWRLIRVWPNFIYHFEKAEPSAVQYRFDFRTETDAELADYFQMCQDAGWEHVCNQGALRYFRADANTALATEFFSDSASMIAKYKRIAALLALVLLPYVYLYPMLIGGDVNMEQALPPVVFIALRTFLILSGAFVAYALIRTLLLIQKLTQERSMQNG